jgi:hypothetical protein
MWKENINQKSKYPVGRTLVDAGFESRRAHKLIFPLVYI